MVPKSEEIAKIQIKIEVQEENLESMKLEFQEKIKVLKESIKEEYTHLTEIEISFETPECTAQESQSSESCTFPGDDADQMYKVATGKDFVMQLKQMSIPVFSGKRGTYEKWKAAF